MEGYLANLKTYRVNLPELQSKMIVKDDDQDILPPSFFELDNKSSSLNTNANQQIPLKAKEQQISQESPEKKKTQNVNYFFESLKTNKDTSCSHLIHFDIDHEKLKDAKSKALEAKKKIKIKSQKNIKKCLFEKDKIQMSLLAIQKHKNTLISRNAMKLCQSGSTNESLFTQLEKLDNEMKQLQTNSKNIDHHLETLIVDTQFDLFLLAINNLFLLEIQSLTPFFLI